MPALTIPNSFSAGTTAVASQVNANFNAVVTLLNTTLLDSTNIQASGIASSNLAANCVTGAKLNSNVVDDSTLQYTSSQLSIKALGVAAAHIAANAVTTAKILDANVTTAKLADGAVTKAKLGTFGQQVSTSVGDANSTSASFTDSGLSRTFTTSSANRPVFIALQSSGSEANGGMVVGRTSTSNVNFAILRDSTIIGYYSFRSAGAGESYFPCTFFHVDTGASASTAYTYKVQYKSSGGSVVIKDAVLLVFEL